MRSVALVMLLSVVMLFSSGAILANSREEASESEIVWPGRLQPITLSLPPVDDNEPAENLVIPASAYCVQAAGCPSNECIAALGNGLQPSDGNSWLNGHFGVMYIRPYWSRSNFSITLPMPTGTFVGDTRDVTQAFNLSPILQFTINPGNTSIGLSMSGYMIQFGSALDRNITNTAGNADLTSSNTLSLWVANLPEITLPRDSEKHCFIFHAGFRYNQIQQTYSATLTSSSSNSTANLQSFQKFTGFGGTCSLEWKSSAKRNNEPCLCLFTEIRGSATVGNNQRSSSFVNPTSPLVAQTNNTISESRVSLVPVGELYAGIEYNHPFTKRRWSTISCGYEDSSGKAKVRMGCTGQIWGDVGMPSAVGNNQPNNGSLYLVGFLVATGIEF